MYIILITAFLYFHFQTIEDVNTDQLDELIKVIMIVCTHSLDSELCAYTMTNYSLSLSLSLYVGGDSNLEREPGLCLYS